MKNPVSLAERRGFLVFDRKKRCSGLFLKINLSSEVELTHLIRFRKSKCDYSPISASITLNFH